MVVYEPGGRTAGAGVIMESGGAGGTAGEDGAQTSPPQPAAAANRARAASASGGASVSLVSTVTPSTQLLGAPAAAAPSAIPVTAARTISSPPCVCTVMNAA